MYAFRIPGEANLRTNAALREYARLEYRGEDVQWLLAAARTPRHVPRARRALLRLARRTHPSPRPVACKGTPRRAAEEAASPA